MTQLPKAIPELDGGLYLPRQVVDLLESVLNEHEVLLRQQGEAREALTVLDETRELLRMTGVRPSLPPAREQLGLDDPQEQMVGRNLLRG